MIRQNLHTHSEFDDGKNTMEEMAEAAIAAGFTSLGFSVHSPLPFQDAWEWTTTEERLPEYMAKAERLKEAYRGRIALYTGTEWDLLSQTPLEAFDYVIGSIHHIFLDGEAHSVDASADNSAGYLKSVFHGDSDAAAEAYFRQYTDLANVSEVDIVGHFDLLTKFDEMRGYYNPESPRFRAAALSAMDALVQVGKIFEINTGAIARGLRTVPYPSRALLLELKKRNARITISSDAHAVGTIDFWFREAEALAIYCGFTELWVLEAGAFRPVPLMGD